jgi:hypothetical protein
VRRPAALLGFVACVATDAGAAQEKPPAWPQALEVWNARVRAAAQARGPVILERLLADPGLGPHGDAATQLRAIAQGASDASERERAREALRFLADVQAPVKPYLLMLARGDDTALDLGRLLVAQSLRFAASHPRSDFADNARAVAALVALAPLSVGATEAHQARYRRALEVLAPALFGYPDGRTLRDALCAELLGGPCEGARSDEAFWDALGGAAAERVEWRLYDVLLEYAGSELREPIGSIAASDEGAGSRRFAYVQERLRRAGGAAPGRAGLSAAAARRVIDAGRDETARCYDSQVRHGTPAGTLDVEVELRGDGSVAQARAAGGTLRRTLVAACVVHVVGGWLFPPAGEDGVVVAVPLRFTAATTAGDGG